MDRLASYALESPAFELAFLSDLGRHRDNNEDCCGSHADHLGSVLFMVADGVGGYEGGEIASAQAVEVTVREFGQSPPSWAPAKRLHRAVQQANIEVHNRALTVPELRRMGTTLTAAVVDQGVLYAAHIGDSRLYHLRRGKLRQITKDHTAIQERVRMGLMSASRARDHPDRGALSRCLGHELIVAVDRITMPLQQHDRVIVCTDGLYNVLAPDEFEHTMRGCDAPTACRRLVDLANQRDTGDNLSVAVFTMKAAVAPAERRVNWRQRLAQLLRRPA